MFPFPPVAVTFALIVKSSDSVVPSAARRMFPPKASFTLALTIRGLCARMVTPPLPPLMASAMVIPPTFLPVSSKSMTPVAEVVVKPARPSAFPSPAPIVTPAGVIGESTIKMSPFALAATFVALVWIFCEDDPIEPVTMSRRTPPTFTLSAL